MEIKKFFKFRIGDIVIGVLLIVVAVYLNQISISLQNYYYIKLPKDRSNAFYFKKLINGDEVSLYLKDNNLSRVIFYQIKSKDKVYKGFMVIPDNYFMDTITILFDKNNTKLLYKKDYFTNQFYKKQMKELEEYIKRNY